MNVKSQKQIAAKILKVGISRVRVKSEKEVEEAITRDDIRNLIQKGLIYKIPKKGITRVYAKRKKIQKKKGRRKGQGSRKGSAYTRKPKKTRWIERVNPLRRLLRDLRNSGKLEKKEYRRLYLMIKGGLFRNKKHLFYYLKEHELLKEPEKKKEEKKPTKVKKVKSSKERAKKGGK
jgi:large subunit ribosomal protein L19e